MEGDRPKAFWTKKLKMSLEKGEGHHSVTGEWLLAPEQAEGACVAWNSAAATQFLSLTRHSRQAKSMMLGNGNY